MPRDEIVKTLVQEEGVASAVLAPTVEIAPFRDELTELIMILQAFIGPGHPAFRTDDLLSIHSPSIPPGQVITGRCKERAEEQDERSINGTDVERRFKVSRIQICEQCRHRGKRYESPAQLPWRGDAVPVLAAGGIYAILLAEGKADFGCHLAALPSGILRSRK